MPDGATIARGVVTVTSSRVVGLVFTLIQVKLTVNHLGANDYGLLSIVTLFIASFAAWTELGMTQVIVRRVSGGGADLTRQVGLMQAVSFAVLGPLIAVINAVAHFMYRDLPEVTLGIAILSIGVVATTIANTFAPVALVKGVYSSYALSDVLGRGVSLGLVTVAVLTDGGLLLYFIAQLAIPVGQFLAMSVLGRRHGPFRPIWNRPELVSLARETLPMTYISAIGVLYFSIDGILLSKLAIPEQVAAYGLAYKITGHVTIISETLSRLLLGRFAEQVAQSREALAESLASSLQVVLLVAVPFATLVWPLAPDLIRLVASEEMVGLASRPFAGVALAIAIGMVLALVSAALVAAHEQRFLTRLSTFNLVLNIALNLILIPRYQAMGSAIALVVSELSGLIVSMVMLSKHYGWVLSARSMLLIPPVLAALATEQFLGGQNWALRLAACGVVYACAALALGAVRIGEMRRLLRR